MGHATFSPWRNGFKRGLVGLALLLGVGQIANAERVALVFGNGRYAHAPLLNAPERDAQAVTDALTALGFRVTGPLLDQTKAAMEAALGTFGEQARSADAAVVYFSGHGMEVGGINYLIPVNAKLQHESQAMLEAVPLEVVLNQVGGARNYGLVILDACRDNPLANQMRLAEGRTKDWVGKGLKPIEPSGQVYVAYAAKGGTKALEGNSLNSPFTTVLLNYLRNYRQEPLPLSNLFGAVREDVLAATSRAQEPWLYGAFGRKTVYLIDEPSPSLQAGQIFRDTLSDGTRGPSLVVIPKGSFQMGSPEGEAGRDPDERQHAVTIAHAFALGQNEVTVGEFRRFVEASGYQTEAEKNAGGKKGCFTAYREGSDWTYGYRAGHSWKDPNFKQGEEHPVVCVSWNDAMAYVEWLSKQTGQRYRLPTEAEWEYAARAGTTGVRYWGDDANQACVYANVADHTAKGVFSDWSISDCTDNHVYTASVGTYSPNRWKLNDMLGNVLEWTCSKYTEGYDGSEQECVTKDTGGPFALRGGSWNNEPARVRSANRFGNTPAYRNSNLGFRLARSL